ncbi:M20 family metallo-hydrolase [Cytobacillus oceanisediminis]|uniref:Zn-dependent hydrolase n=2 Tax=Cytobacillus TaxID=2675230 RepID=A0A160MCK4_9BACI|nr:M20 family metallo-hydrolase [Cytobacillus oceanisediminis]AND40444.1 Zn-dependent hydrolase [Cytobacillus oceanisediminis 2691]USK42109.1 M20 family metallo-hydrolase [Cytobacillus oceanisediminis]
METTKLMVNRKRLLDTINVSSSIGALENGGLNRLALTEEDKKMRNIFVKWLQEEKLDVRVDDLGNIYGRRKGKLNNSPAVAIGSHLDTQPCGGRFDGILGVLTALEVVRTLNENNIETDYPIEIVNFTNEEGARFEPPMLGSGGVAGEFTTDFIYNTKDNENISFQEALKKIQYMGDEKHRLRDIKYFIELHVEQGPILEKNNKLIGIVEGIQGISWLNVKVVGETNHAGPTPMEDRKDALAPSAKMVTKVYEITNEIEGLKTTVGKLNVKPNITNVIPGEVEFMIDVRHKDDEIRAGTIDRLREQLGTIAVMNNVEVTISTDWNSDAVLFSSEVMDAISEAAGVLGYSTLRLFSGPGHDAKYISKMADTGMIFLPSINGISHNEKELTLEDDIEKGANVLLNTILKLARAH